jgi:two-component system, OmpR family, response regulator
MSRSKVLIIDDDPDVLQLLRLVLEQAGYAPALASDGLTALRRIEEERPMVVLLDVMMPVMDGWEVLEMLAQAPSHPPVVVISAKSTERDRARAFELGAAEYVAKPFTPESVVATIARVLS